MSSSNLANKLVPAKKAWKSFTEKLQSSVHKLNISYKFVKKTTRRLKSLPRALTRQCSHPGHQHQHQHHLIHKNMAAIYVDELYAGPISSTSKQIHPHKGKSKAKEMGETSSTSGGNEAKGEKVFSLPQWQGIDERAEEFISKFREEMKLEKEKSIVDFLEMLARSA